MKTILVVLKARGRKVILDLSTKEEKSGRLLTEVATFIEENSGEIFIF